MDAIYREWCRKHWNSFKPLCNWFEGKRQRCKKFILCFIHLSVLSPHQLFNVAFFSRWNVSRECKTNIWFPSFRPNARITLLLLSVRLRPPLVFMRLLFLLSNPKLNLIDRWCFVQALWNSIEIFPYRFHTSFGNTIYAPGDGINSNCTNLNLTKDKQA